MPATAERERLVEDLDVRYRPKTLDEVVGQPEAVDVVRSWGRNIPRTVMFTGLTGCGKSTLARIIGKNILDISSMDYVEINCGSVKPMELIRDLESAVTAAPTSGDKRMWVMDEFQTFSRAKNAQESLLMILEKAQPHVVFCLCTTDPQRIIATIRGRSVIVPLRALHHDELCGLINRISKSERVKVNDELVQRIADVANGSARNAIKELQKVISIEDSQKQLAVIGGVGVQKVAGDLIRELMPFKGSPNWLGVSRVLADCKEEDPEGIRQMLLAVARTGLLRGGSGADYYALVISNLERPYFDRNSGHAILTKDCYEICRAANKL